MHSPQSNSDINYKKHPIFKDLDVYETFYEDLIFTISSVGLAGVGPHISINSDILANLKGTIYSFRLLLESKLLNDGNALLRKFHEVSNFHVYLLLYISHETKKNLENGTLELFVDKVKKWIDDTAQFDSFANQLSYIKTSHELSDAYAILDYDNRYASIKKRANEHIHLNSWHNSFLNNNTMYYEGRENILDIFRIDLLDVIICHTMLLFVLQPFYMCSENYLEFAEMNQPLPAELKNKAMPFIDIFFIKVVLPHRKDIYAFVEKETGILFESPLHGI
ncbi:hypothetical protein [[Flexibacter] sp. ATCC 35208]|uniref:hypothetical protein n=1 Tax=[Flexibacter] sp. ATCC 35208 TaxID=1936242 RepID=UPI0009CAD566|nr:hypothetical protein [[Flexibacter] sp. ATCC 35208]OMP74563.1 hypothetical protein BW716_34700 [[Flexibacter] sp. ATCC 35208]